MKSRIQGIIGKKKADNGDNLVDTLIDICFVTSYKIEDLIAMPPARRELLIKRYQEKFCK